MKIINLFSIVTCPPPPRRQWAILAEPNPTQNPCLFTTMCDNVLCDNTQLVNTTAIVQHGL